MKKITTAFVFLSASLTAFAQDEEPSAKFGSSLSLNTDAFFGLYPMATGYYKLSDNVDFTFYGIMWTDLGSNGGGLGSWTEFGVGANFTVADGALNLNPQIGLLSGTLLSKSNGVVFGEGVVPNLTANLGTGNVEGQFYFGYYLPLFADNSMETGVDRNSFVHYWLYMGGDLGLVSVGGHFEQLNQPTGAGPEGINVYTWLGPYDGTECHGGLDINHPAGTPIWTPVRMDEHGLFARGGQDGAAMQQAMSGAVAAGVVCGTRYIHTVTEMIDKRDLAAARDLLVKYLPTIG